ncbi:class I SAM-dependent methyltransferase [Nocardia sp. NPDC050717]|uniref:class I SAM-dependent methyltransferase n=1 Tax=Nocardia sp. NPDC050717 TaxID=3157221 RepID=UPI0033D685A0
MTALSPCDARSATAPPADPRQVPAVPRGARADAGRLVAAALFRRAVRRLPLRVELPDGTMFGGGVDDPTTPRMVLHDPDAFATRLGATGLIGFGEAYMTGDWSAPDPAAVLTVFAGHLRELVPAPLRALRPLLLPRRPARTRATPDGARDNAAHHYDLSNDFFAAFLDETMTYSAALFDRLEPAPEWDDLAAAQHAKIDRLLDGAGVGPGTAVLEIGTGWGELAIRAARRGATVHSVTLSREQLDLARHRVAAAGVADRVTIELRDYREVEGRYDAVISVEMIEAVGYDFLAGYLTVLERALAPGGRIALQVITMPHDRMRAGRTTHTWVQKYIFPGGFLPSAELLTELLARHTGLELADRATLGQHYAHTLRLWRERFTAAEDHVAALGFDEVFRRMWRLYLAYSEAGFHSGYLDCLQLILRPAPTTEEVPR